MPTEAEKLQEEVDSKLAIIESLEDKCDTLDICQEDDGCSKCESFKKIEAMSAEVEKLEEKIEELLSADEE